METYTLPYGKQTASGKLAYNTRELNSVLCDNLEGWEGGPKGKGHMYTYDQPIHVDVWQKSSQYCNYPLIKNKI